MPKKAILRDNRGGGWFWIDNLLVDHGASFHIGAMAWVTYTMIVRHADPKGVAFPGVELIMAESGLSRRTVSDSIGKLKQAGLIVVNREDHQHNIYLICDAKKVIAANKWKKVSGTKKTESHERHTHKADAPDAHGMSATRTRHVQQAHPKKNNIKRPTEEELLAAPSAQPLAQTEQPTEKPTKARKPKAEVVSIPQEIRDVINEIVYYWHFNGRGVPKIAPWSQITSATNKLWINFDGDLERIQAAHTALKGNPGYAAKRNMGFDTLVQALHTFAPKPLTNSPVTPNPQNSAEVPSRALQRREEGIWKSWRDVKENCGPNTTIASLESQNMSRPLVGQWRQIPAIWAEVETFFAARTLNSDS